MGNAACDIGIFLHCPPVTTYCVPCSKFWQLKSNIKNYYMCKVNNLKEQFPVNKISSMCLYQGVRYRHYLKNWRICTTSFYWKLRRKLYPIVHLSFHGKLGFYVRDTIFFDRIIWYFVEYQVSRERTAYFAKFPIGMCDVRDDSH